MTDKFKAWLCKIGFHAWRYDPDAPWSIWTIYGCEDYRCKDCGKLVRRLYPDHPHTHKYPKRGAVGGLR